MAVDPLFNDKTLLLQKLRMAETSDLETLTLIDQAISDVRLEFYRRLGIARVEEILAISSIDNPSTENELLRGNADVAEVYWVMYKLICIMPVMFIETQYAIRNNFDDVPLVRDSESLLTFRKCLFNSVEQKLGQLVSPVESNTGEFKSFSTGRPTPFLLNQNNVGLNTTLF